MNILRKLCIGLGTPLLSLCIFTAVLLLSMNSAFGKSDNLKRWLRESKLYDNIVPAIIAENKKTPPQGWDGADVPFSQPEVQTALQKAVTPTWLQQSAENVVDGTYSWLQGKTTKPTYAIDVSGIKSAFATSLADQARARLATLPACSLRNQPASTDPFTINCQPPANVTEAEIQKLITEVKNSKDLLPEGTITADTTSLGNTVDKNGQPMTDTTAPLTTPQSPSQPWYQQAKHLPTLYQWTMRGPLILGVLSVLLGIALLFAAATKRQGAKIIASTTFSAGVLVAVGAAFMWLIASKLRSDIGQQGAPTGLQQPFLSLVKLVTANISQTQLVVSGILIVLSAAALIALYVTKPTTPVAADSSQTPAAPTLPPPAAPTAPRT